MSVRSRPPGATDERASVQQLFDRLCNYDPSKPLVHVSRSQRYPTTPTAVRLLAGKEESVADEVSGGSDTTPDTITDDYDTITYELHDEAPEQTTDWGAGFHALKNLMGARQPCFDDTLTGDELWAQDDSKAVEWLKLLNEHLVNLEDSLTDASSKDWFGKKRRVNLVEDVRRAFKSYGAAVEVEQKSPSWSEVGDEDGRYYFNALTGKTSWQKPIVDEALLEANDNFENAHTAFIGMNDRMIQAKASLQSPQNLDTDLKNKVDFFAMLFKYVAFCAAFRSTRPSLLTKAKNVIDAYSEERGRTADEDRNNYGDSEFELAQFETETVRTAIADRNNYGYSDIGLTRFDMETCIKSPITAATLQSKIRKAQQMQEGWKLELALEESRLSRARVEHQVAGVDLNTSASSLSNLQKKHKETRDKVDNTEGEREQLWERREQELLKLDRTLLSAKVENEDVRKRLSEGMEAHKQAVEKEQTARTALESAKEAVEALKKHARDFK